MRTKLSSLRAALPRHYYQSSGCGNSHRNRCIGGLLLSFKIVTAPNFCLTQAVSLLLALEETQRLASIGARRDLRWTLDNFLRL